MDSFTNKYFQAPCRSFEYVKLHFYGFYMVLRNQLQDGLYRLGDICPVQIQSGGIPCGPSIARNAACNMYTEYLPSKTV